MKRFGGVNTRAVVGVGWCIWSPSVLSVCTVTQLGVIGPYCFEEEGVTVTVNSERYVATLGQEWKRNWWMCGSNSSHSSKLGDVWCSNSSHSSKLGECVVPIAHTAPKWGMCGSNSSHSSKIKGCVVPTAHTAPNWGMCGSNSSHSSKFN
jgi:hypothetical protein